ncbi:hypothetical protein YC2023_038460 [Brassica napus]
MANNMQLTFLNDIKPHKTACCIQVKIIHTWRHFMKDVGESMELILCDANGAACGEILQRIFTQLASKQKVKFKSQMLMMQVRCLSILKYQKQVSLNKGL